MRRLVLFGLIILLLLPCGARSQTYSFKSINELFDTSVREITAVCRDDDGFVWAAARTCILRVTPYDIRTYELPFYTTDVVQVRIVYRNGQLIACTQNGQVFGYNPILNLFERSFNLSDWLDGECWVTTIWPGDDGALWIGTNKGLYIWERGALKPAFDLPNISSYITPYKDAKVLVLMAPNLYLVDTHQHTKELLSDRLPLSISMAHYDEQTENVWIGTFGTGLWQYNLTSKALLKSQIPAFPQLVVRSILAPDSTSLWVGIDGAGIWVLDREGKQVRTVLKEDLNNPSSLRGNGVYAMLVDDKQRVWVGTNSGGLSYTETAPSVVEHIVHQLNNPHSPSNNQISRILQDSGGNLWFATNDGLCRRDARTGAWTHFYQGRSLVFLSLATDGKGHIYAGTYGQGLYQLDEQTGRELNHYTTNEGKLFGEGACIFDIYRDSMGDMWIGGIKGNVYCYHTQERKFATYTSESVYCFAEWMPGNMLLGCTYGLLMLEKESGRIYPLVSEHTVYDIAVVGRTIWACTSGGGLLGFDMDTRHTEYITTQSGLPSNYTSSVLVVDSTLWIGTEKGLCRLSLADRSVQTFASIPELSGASFNINTACVLHDDRLAFGTGNGAVLFHAADLKHVQPSARIYFSDIRIDGRSIRSIPALKLTTPIDSLTSLHLDYPQNAFTLSVLPLGDVSKTATFSWMLEGADTEWSAFTVNRFINYTNLHAGTYTLHIRLYDGTLLSSREFCIVVSPPFWETVWFLLFMIVLLISVVGFIIRFYVNRLHRHYAEEKIRFFAQMAHDVRTSLTLIKAPVEELQKETALSMWGAKCLRLASEQISRLTATATQLLDFQKIDVGREQPVFSSINLTELVSRRISVHDSHAQSRHIEIVYAAEPDNYWAEVDARLIERVVDNLISNAVKYSQAGKRIEVTFIGDAQQWVLRVRDYGMGISKTAQRKLFREFYRSDNAVNARIVGSGIGLLMAKKYVAIHGGKIRVESELNVGSTFEVIVPLRQHSFKTELPGTADYPAEVVTKEAMPQALSDIPTHDMHILIVEDNKALREFMAHPLRNHFHVSTATDGVQAWAFIQENLPDLVVSDVVMPEMDGFELCRLIKSSYETSHIPVILLTALSDTTDQLRGLGLGADSYLLKPFDMDLLTGRMKSIIQNRRTVLEKALRMQRNQERQILENQINDEFLKKAVACVRANITNGAFDKDEFASSLALSPSLLYKKIKILTNLSVVEFIREIRLNYAMELLQSGKYNVTEVSELCGFNTVAYFSKVFKEYYGKAPTKVMNE